MKQSLRRVGVVFSGGPAPGANAVIASAASGLIRDSVEVVGLLQGYSHVVDYDGDRARLVEGVSHKTLAGSDLRGLRNARGILLGTARAHPGGTIASRDDLLNPERTRGLRAVYRALCDLELDALISIGGDGTLRTAGLLHAFQGTLPERERRIRILHVPKTIDNDYAGIDFTFGFFTAIDVLAKEVLNLRADAVATQSYYVVSTMGRNAGWLAYGVALAGEAHLVLGVEDVTGSLRRADGKLDLTGLVDRIVDLIEARRARGKEYGVVVLAEGLVGELPEEALRDIPRDRYGNVSFTSLDLSRLVASHVAARHRERVGDDKKVTGVQLGYEARCSAPHAFDVLLGSQLGHGAYLALTQSERDGCMVTVSGQLKLDYLPFARLLDPQSLRTQTRFLDPGSDFHRLAQALGTRLPTAR